MESTTTPGSDPTQDPNAAPGETPEDPAARTPEQDADLEGSPATPGEQTGEPVEQDPGTGGGDPANEVHRTAAPPADWQSGEPNPQTTSADREVQTAGGSTDGLSAGTTAEDGGEPEPEDPEV